MNLKKPCEITKILQNIIQTEETELTQIMNIIKYCCYFYQFTDLPNPITEKYLPELKKYNFTQEDIHGDQTFWKIAYIFKLPKFKQLSINKTIAFIDMMNNEVCKHLQPQFKYFRLDFKILVIIIYKLFGKNNFETIFRQNYPKTQAKFLDVVFFDLFIKIINNLFATTQLNFRFEYLEKQFQPRIPQDLDTTLSNLFPLVYKPSPFQFLFSLLKCTDSIDLFDAAAKIQKIDKQLQKEVLLQHKQQFNLFYTPNKNTLFEQQCQQQFKNWTDKYQLFSSRKIKEAQMLGNYKEVVSIQNNDRVDKEYYYLSNLLIQKGYLERQINQYGFTEVMKTSKYGEIQQQNLLHSLCGVDKGQILDYTKPDHMLSQWLGFIDDKEQQLTETEEKQQDILQEDILVNQEKVEEIETIQVE